MLSFPLVAFSLLVVLSIPFMWLCFSLKKMFSPLSKCGVGAKAMGKKGVLREGIIKEGENHEEVLKQGGT